MKILLDAIHTMPYSGVVLVTRDAEKVNNLCPDWEGFRKTKPCVTPAGAFPLWMNFMNKPSVFSNPEFGSVRVFMKDGEPWFVARDIAIALGYADPADAIQRHCKKVNDSNMGVSPAVPSPKIIPESDVYRLIMRSNLPTAEKFQTWVCEEVLPSIRKTGGYSMTNMPDFTNPAQAARAWADEYEAKMLAQKKVKELAETVEAQEMALGDHRDWKAVTAIPWLKEYFRDTKPSTCARIGKVLTMFSKVKGYEVKKIEDPRWGSVNSYHIETINWLKDVLDREPDRLADIRIK